MGVVLPAGSGLTGRCRDRQQLLPALQPSLGRGRRQPCGAPRWHANRRRCCPPLPSGHWHRQLRVEVGHRAVAVAPAQPLTVVRLQHKLDAPARPEAGADRLETPAAHRSPPPPPPPPGMPQHAASRRCPPPARTHTPHRTLSCRHSLRGKRRASANRVGSTNTEAPAAAAMRYRWKGTCEAEAPARGRGGTGEGGGGGRRRP